MVGNKKKHKNKRQKIKLYNIYRFMLTANIAIIIIIFSFIGHIYPNLINYLIFVGLITIGGHVATVIFISKELTNLSSKENKRKVDDTSNLKSFRVIKYKHLSFPFFLIFLILGSILETSILSILFFTFSFISFNIFIHQLLSSKQAKKELSTEMRKSMYGITISASILFWSIVVLNINRINDLWEALVGIIMILALAVFLISISYLVIFNLKKHRDEEK